MKTWEPKGKATREERDQGVLFTLMQRLEKYRLPAALRLQERVDRGETLPERDVRFLSTVQADLRRIQPLLDRNPEYKKLADEVTELLTDISEKALQNEKNQ